MVTSISEVFTFSQLSSWRQNGQMNPPRSEPWIRSRTFSANRRAAVSRTGAEVLLLFAFAFLRAIEGQILLRGTPRRPASPDLYLTNCKLQNITFSSRRVYWREERGYGRRTPQRNSHRFGRLDQGRDVVRRLDENRGQGRRQDRVEGKDFLRPGRSGRRRGRRGRGEDRRRVQ